MLTGEPLYRLLNEVNVAAKNNLSFLAVAMAVALPDICVSLAAEDARTTGERYRAWCAANLPSDQFSFVMPDDLWSMRCGILHNGRFGDLKHNVGRVIFMPPGGSSFTNCRVNDAYVYGVREFCRNVCTAVYAWCEANLADPVIQSNLPRMMQYRDGGLAPYVGGRTVLA